MPELPIDFILPELRRALAGHEAAVLQAPPGAGKTTRVPLALLREAWLAGKSILMLEPRRLAATNAARYMASTIGERVGQSVGYAIRYDRRISDATRIEVVTEGILTRRLQADPLLPGVGLVIFDEFHERSLNSDLALALCRDAQMGLREDLKLLVMSATLDAEPVADLLGGAPLVTSEGRSFPVDLRYLSREPRGPLPEIAAASVRRALGETEGDVLVFLPGAGEIRRTGELLSAEPGPGLPRLCPLYGDLPFAEQERAILPGEERKVVLATNIAETSLTIEGIRVVVDGGMERRPRFDPARGLTRLETTRISRASAEQRAGRAGRLGPGVCYRLWTEGIHGSLLPFTPPEIRAADLAPLALELARWGVFDPASLAWLDPPPEGALAAGRRLLKRLGALDGGGRITPLGEEMAGFPTHPRLARLLIEGKGEGCPALACEIAALLSERDIFRGGREPSHRSESDLPERLETLRIWRREKRALAGADPSVCRSTERAATYWRRHLGCEKEPAGSSWRDIGRLLAAAFPDRIGREREPQSGRYLLADGQGGRLSSRSAVRGEPLLVAVEMQGGRRGEGRIDLASALAMEDLERLFGADLRWEKVVVWEEREGRVSVREERRLGALTLSSRPARAGAEEVTAALLDGVRRLGLEVLAWSREATELAARVEFLRRTFPEEGWPEMSGGRLLETAEEWLAPFLAGLRSRADLERFDPLPALRAQLDWSRQRRLDEEAPTHLAIPSGSRIRLLYGEEGPVLAVKLQELFGLADTPRIAGGRVPVLLHLLSPARRPIQVTRDLKSFWDQGYPEVKKELKGRYPKHPWPDDPWNAEPTRKTKKGRD